LFSPWPKTIKDRITHISGRDYVPILFSLEWVLAGLSCLYGIGVWFWLWLYEKKIMPAKELPCFVISIGNIVAGGAGKTPMTLYVAKLLKEIGKNPAVISRGYKGSYKEESMIVSDGQMVFSKAEESGDEPFMMASRLLFPVVVGKDRYRAGLMALDCLKPMPDVMVLDDGFQHVKLKRNLNLLLFDFRKPLGNKRLLPAGRLREGVQGSAKRADAVIFTRCSEKKDTGSPVNEVLHFFPNAPVFKTFHKPHISRWIKLAENLPEPESNMTALKGKKAVLFSGLADNQVFYDSVTGFDINVLHHLEFEDHHRYKTSDCLMINRMAMKNQADLILTTQKDRVKIDPCFKWAVDFLLIDIQIEFEHPEKFKDFIVSKMEEK